MALGWESINKGMGSMSAIEYVQWAEYDRRFSLDFTRRLELMIAQLTMVLAEIHRNPKKRATRFTTKQFMPDEIGELELDSGDFGSDEDEQEAKVRKIERMIRAMNTAMGGKVITRGNDADTSSDR